MCLTSNENQNTFSEEHKKNLSKSAKDKVASDKTRKIRSKFIKEIWKKRKESIILK